MTGHKADDYTHSAVVDTVIAPRDFDSFRLSAGQVLRFVDSEGQQCADLIALDPDDLTSRLSPTMSVSRNGRLYLGVGDQLVDDDGEPMLTIIADTVEHHDILCGSCSPGLNRVRHGGRGAGKRTCHVNFAEALRPYGVPAEDVPYSFNIFMNYPVSQDGSMEYATCRSSAGDHIDFRAERDLLVVVSNCPQELTPLNGFTPSSSQVIVFAAAGGNA
ncbi:DUF1989 domain-containing protein [Qaidamihabitans albus]|uniref:DUF1989 domain-containing protein n=1 Tax=Qaidamihabitans albus TaxID=2795733 RepID=UPI0018F1522B|nr:urea carboxylase-associated family protein [Qaidamihabitans albus]